MESAVNGLGMHIACMALVMPWTERGCTLVHTFTPCICCESTLYSAFGSLPRQRLPQDYRNIWPGKSLQECTWVHAVT